MADNKKQEAGAEAGGAPAKPMSKQLVFILIGVLVLVILGGAVAAYFTLKKKPKEEAEGEPDVPPAKITVIKPPNYLKLEQFTTNLATEDGSDNVSPQYVQVVVELKVTDGPQLELLKQFLPEVRDKILRILSSHKPSQLASPANRDALALEVREAVNTLVNPQQAHRTKEGKPIALDFPVEAAVFSSFIVQ